MSAVPQHLVRWWARPPLGQAGLRQLGPGWPPAGGLRTLSYWRWPQRQGHLQGALTGAPPATSPQFCAFSAALRMLGTREDGHTQYGSPGLSLIVLVLQGMPKVP